MQKVWGYAIATLIIGLVIGAAVGYISIKSELDEVRGQFFKALSDIDELKEEVQELKKQKFFLSSFRLHGANNSA